MVNHIKLFLEALFKFNYSNKDLRYKLKNSHDFAKWESRNIKARKKWRG